MKLDNLEITVKGQNIEVRVVAEIIREALEAHADTTLKIMTIGPSPSTDVVLSGNVTIKQSLKIDDADPLLDKFKQNFDYAVMRLKDEG